MAISFIAGNHPMATTAAPVAVTTGTAIKTLLQIAPPATGSSITPVVWGISFSGFAAAAPITCELVETDVAATVTAHVAAGVQPYNRDSSANISTVRLGTGLTGYTASAEGTITASRHADVQLIAPTGQYVREWSLGREFEVGPGKFLRVRVTAAAAVNALCWVIWEE